MKKVFTNGCFDLLHPGHIYILNEAKKLGDKLIVGLDSDEIVLYHKQRLIYPFNVRKKMLLSLEAVDEVHKFNGWNELEQLIKDVKPDILVKGDDYKDRKVCGSQFVKEVKFITRHPKYSTTGILKTIQRCEYRTKH